VSKLTLKGAKKKAWSALSEFIRYKAADHTGMACCVTCGTAKYWKELDAGHFIAKGKGLAVYFEEENIHPQCTYCNRYQSGNLIEYTRYMIDIYGIEKVDELRALAKKAVKYKIHDYLEMEADYKMRLKDLQS
jgi:hypothetical protein